MAFQPYMQESTQIEIKVINHVDAFLAYWDCEQRCMFANSAHEKWFGTSGKPLIGITLQELLGPLYERNLPQILGALNGEMQVFERAFTLPDGTKRYSITSYFPDVVDGAVCGFTSQVADVTPLKNLEFKLRDANAHAEFLATHDFLTGLPNRVLLMDNIRSAMARVRRDGGIFGVIAIDMDGFKSINDTYGHHAGDVTLKEVAERMQSAIRATDTVTRLGGDEFICLVNDIQTSDELAHAVDRLLEAVCRPMPLEGATVNPRISCGVALFPSNGVTEAELMTNADTALYRAKKQGSIRVAFAE